MRIVIICTVRAATDGYRRRLERHAATLESQGHEVYLPHRDTPQDVPTIEICRLIRAAIEGCAAVHLFYNPGSRGTHFDMGMAWALRKPIKCLELPAFGEGESYPRMAKEWEREREGE